MARCPGQDMRYWTPEDIFYMECPYCKNQIEFWKDEPFRICQRCGKEIENPRIDLGCAKWCKYGDECLGKRGEENVAIPISHRLEAELEKHFDSNENAQQAMKYSLEVSRRLITSVDQMPYEIICAALLSLAAKLDTSFAKADGFDAILVEASIDPELTVNVKEMTDAIISGKTIDDESFSLVQDIVAITNAKYGNGDCKTIEEELITNIAKKYIAEKL